MSWNVQADVLEHALENVNYVKRKLHFKRLDGRPFLEFQRIPLGEGGPDMLRIPLPFAPTVIESPLWQKEGFHHKA